MLIVKPDSGEATPPRLRFEKLVERMSKAKSARAMQRLCASAEKHGVTAVELNRAWWYAQRVRELNARVARLLGD